MKMSIKLIFRSLIATLGVLFMSPALVRAADTDPGVTKGMLDNFNTAIFDGAAPNVALTTPRGILGRLLPYLFTIAGLVLFVMIIWGGFEMLTGAANPKSQEAGKQRITAAVIGFLLLFSSYWIAQIVEAIFGVSILK